MGEENNLKKQLLFSGMVSASINPEPIHIEKPIPGVTFYDSVNLSEFDPKLEWNHEDTEPIGSIKETINTEQSFECTIEPHDMKAFRKLIGLPAIPTKKPKRHRKTFKKALMAYGYSRDKAEAICKVIGGHQANKKRFNGMKTWNPVTDKIEVIHWGYKFYYEHAFTVLGD